jgi:hypothetical protein
MYTNIGGTMDTKETRVRYGVKQTAKGSVQLDITAEAPTAVEAEEMLRDGISRLSAAVKDAGLVAVHEA